MKEKKNTTFNLRVSDNWLRARKMNRDVLRPDCTLSEYLRRCCEIGESELYRRERDQCAEI